jgi:L-alanine-DL-glutamate epimerase-like enolase superfamily enzyme
LTLTSSGLAEDVVREPLRIEGGHAAVPEGIGLGIEIDEQRLQRDQPTRMVA